MRAAVGKRLLDSIMASRLRGDDVGERSMLDMRDSR
jgi:hypothetical protein